MIGLVWEDPPVMPERNARKEIVAELQAKPGTWARVDTEAPTTRVFQWRKLGCETAIANKRANAEGKARCDIYARWPEQKAGAVVTVSSDTQTLLGDLRVWWVPQLPMPAFHVLVPDAPTARLVLDALAEYDLFQFEHKVKPDYCNAGGVEVFDGAEWCSTEDEDDL